jgi:myo-inositol-1(or 4)-monophosphatase
MSADPAAFSSQATGGSLPEHLEVAREAARRGAEVLRRHFGTLDTSHAEEKGPKDFVTSVDREAEEAVVGFLSRETPGVAVLAEESAVGGGAEGLCWVIDPLDGTTNYIHAYPFFAVSVALARAARPLAGVVLDPLHGEEFTARRGGGAFLNGNRLRVSRVTALADALVLTGFPFRAVQLLDSYLRSLEAMVRGAAGVRRDGAAALDLCYVACGRADAFWELRLSPWDIAAGSLVVEEAGGKATDFAGGDTHWRSGDILATNGALHAELVRLLRGSFSTPS